MADHDTPPHVRLRTARERKKALAQLTEMRTQGVVDQALVIIKRTDGNYEVLGQELRPDQMWPLLRAATYALDQAEAPRLAKTLEEHEMPLAWGEVSGPSRKTRSITTGADGVLVPPAGETLISCGECRHPRWLVTMREDGNGPPPRLACAHCGNEVVMLPVHHAKGHA